MSIPCKFERSLLSYEEYETVRASHHPAIYELSPDELHALGTRLRTMRDKERTLARQSGERLAVRPSRAAGASLARQSNRRGASRSLPAR